MDGISKSSCFLAAEHCWHEKRCIRRYEREVATFEDRCCECGLYRTNERAVAADKPHGPFR